MPAGFARRDRLRLLLADSSHPADRIEFTVAAQQGRRYYGLVVLSPLLSTPHCCDAVTVRYRTILHRTETDLHRSIHSPFQAHWHGPLARPAGLPARLSGAGRAVGNGLRMPKERLTRSVQRVAGRYGPVARATLVCNPF